MIWSPDDRQTRYILNILDPTNNNNNVCKSKRIGTQFTKQKVINQFTSLNWTNVLLQMPENTQLLTEGRTVGNKNNNFGPLFHVSSSLCIKDNKHYYTVLLNSTAVLHVELYFQVRLFTNNFQVQGSNCRYSPSYHEWPY